MNSVYLILEAKIFCILAIVFLYCFQLTIFQLTNFEKQQTTKTDGPQISQAKERQKMTSVLFAASVLEIVFSGFGSFLFGTVAGNVCCLLCGVTTFAAVYAYCELIAFKKLLSMLVGVLVGVFSFMLNKYRIDVVDLVLTFAIIVLFVVEQYNRIRVDGLTKLYNRYGMYAELREQRRQHQRDPNDSFYIIVCDLDEFKHINDTWGHEEGDKALEFVAKILAKVGKKFSSEVFRIGGDEFIIITDKSPEHLDDDIIKSVQSEFERSIFREDYNIRISMGAVRYNGEDSIDELINSADKKMYETKNNKKQVTV